MVARNQCGARTGMRSSHISLLYRLLSISISYSLCVPSWGTAAAAIGTTTADFNGTQHAVVDGFLQEILKKMGLRERPTMLFDHLEVPTPILEEARQRFADPSGRTKRSKSLDHPKRGLFMVALQPSPELESCTGVPRKVCQQVRIPASIYDGRVVRAHLWLFLQTPTRLTTVTIRLRGYFRNARSYHETEISVKIPHTEVGWFVVDAPDIVKWFDSMEPFRRYTFMLLIYPNELVKTIFGAAGIQRPMIVFSLVNETNDSTGTDCDPMKPDGCCRQRMSIDFSNVGWGDWIIVPKVQEFFFCVGSCRNKNNKELSMSSALRRWYSPNRVDDDGGCCVPSQTSPMPLMYMTEDGYMTFKDIPDMIIESCVCR